MLGVILALFLVVARDRGRLVLPTPSLSNFAAVNSRQRTPCEVAAPGFKGWRNGLVTVLKPVLQSNCSKIFAGDQEEIRLVHAKSQKWKNKVSDREILNRTKNCSWVREYFHNNLYTTKLEKSFPIAYTFVVYNSPQQVLRLLKLLYRPVNHYCVHPDKKADEVFTEIFTNIAACLKNVVISSKRIDVQWGLHTIMTAQMSCLENLVDLRSHLAEQEKWKYVINLCGKELPLTSTHDIVSYLSYLNGSSSINAGLVEPSDRKVFVKRLKKMQNPLNVPIYKSSTYMALSYDFVHYMLTNRTAITLYQFFKLCRHPEEHFYATLYMMPGTKGGFNPNMSYTYTIRSMWLNYANHPPCAGKNVHDICVVASGDLKMVLSGRKVLFQNKYFMEVDHTVMDCMEERLVASNVKEFQSDCVS